MPEHPGVYAWYYQPTLTEFDVKNIIDQINSYKSDDKIAEAKKLVEAFLQRNLMQYFAEHPYQAMIKGPLKPSYTGQLSHESRPSESLVERIVSDSTRLLQIKKFLDRRDPLFGSPIYIGMSSSLKQRLVRHKDLIEKFKQGKFSVGPGLQEDRESTPEQKRDRSFAQEVASRNMSTGDLYVAIREIEDLNDSYVDMENLLNRIYYPLIGRN